MDCAICYEAITAATGKIELSCSHSFHINCLASWFATQQAQKCPYCRHESTELEMIPRHAPEYIYQYNIIREMRNIHNEIQNGLRVEIDVLTDRLRQTEDRLDEALVWTDIAEHDAARSREALDAYKVAVAQKQERKENWNTWAAATRAKSHC